MNRLIEKTFENRQYTPEYLQEINTVHPGTLKDLDKLVERLKTYHDRQDLIVVLSDFDVDGITGGTVFFAGLAELGFNVALFIPNPADGYRFTAATIDRLAGQYPDVQCILTCDVGISCYEGIQRAKDLGIDVLVTDHHMPPSEFAAQMQADVVVDPCQPEDTYPLKAICGAHVAYQCVQRYADQYTEPFVREQIRRLRVFAGIGTVADSMPMIHENRQLVRDSVSICRLIYGNGSNWFVNAMLGCEVYRRAFYGLYIALKGFADAGKIQRPEDIDEDFFGFYFAPAFNSIKRMGGDMITAFGVFFGADPSNSMDILLSTNEERKAAVQGFMDQILQQQMEGIQVYAPYIYFTDAPTGILGLIATKLMQSTNLPTLVIRKDHGWHGSGRSPAWYPFLTRTRADVTLAGSHGAGHESAFGVTFDDDDIQSFFHAFAQDVQTVMASLSDEDFVPAVPDFVISTEGDGDTGIDIMLFTEYLSELDSLRPFGAGFDRPNVRLKFITDDADFSLIGKEKQHVKFTLPYGFDVFCWNQAANFQEMVFAKAEKHPVEIILEGKLQKQVYMDNVSISFVGNNLVSCEFAKIPAQV